jgi:hypothetical protein
MTPKLEFRRRIGERLSHAEAAAREIQIELRQRIALAFKQDTAAVADEVLDMRQFSPDCKTRSGRSRSTASVNRARWKESIWL